MTHWPAHLTQRTVVRHWLLAAGLRIRGIRSALTRFHESSTEYSHLRWGACGRICVRSSIVIVAEVFTTYSIETDDVGIRGDFLPWPRILMHLKLLVSMDHTENLHVFLCHACCLVNDCELQFELRLCWFVDDFDHVFNHDTWLCLRSTKKQGNYVVVRLDQCNFDAHFELAAVNLVEMWVKGEFLNG
jgi:hypothetical protein